MLVLDPKRRGSDSLIVMHSKVEGREVGSDILVLMDLVRGSIMEEL